MDTINRIQQAAWLAICRVYENQDAYRDSADIAVEVGNIVNVVTELVRFVVDMEVEDWREAEDKDMQKFNREMDLARARVKEDWSSV